MNKYTRNKKKEVLYSDKIDEFNADIVDIHCSLCRKIDSLEKLRTIQDKLDKLTEEFYVFCFDTDKTFKEGIANRKKYQRFLKYYMVFNIFSLIIPIIGVVSLLLLEILAINNLIKSKAVLGILERNYDEFQRSTKIIKENINMRYSLLDKRIKEYACGTKDRGTDEDFTYYYAMEMIESYLQGFDLSLEGVDYNLLTAMKNILQTNFKQEDVDLSILLNQAKKENTEKILVNKNV